MALSRGELYRYHYLWSREHERNEISGRKYRPVCLVVRSAAKPTSLFLFPLTSQKPAVGVVALEISGPECRHAGLQHPCWIILEEYNRLTEDELYDFESLTPIGRFGEATMRQIAKGIKRAAELQRLIGVPRA